ASISRLLDAVRYFWGRLIGCLTLQYRHFIINLRFCSDHQGRRLHLSAATLGCRLPFFFDSAWGEVLYEKHFVAPAHPDSRAFGIYFDRAAGGHCHYCDPHRVAAASRSASARGGTAQHV